jgi:hypothetical protein
MHVKLRSGIFHCNPVRRFSPASGATMKPMADSQIQYVSDETGQPVSVIVPIEHPKKFTFEI